MGSVHLYKWCEDQVGYLIRPCIPNLYQLCNFDVYKVRLLVSMFEGGRGGGGFTTLFTPYIKKVKSVPSVYKKA